LPPKPPASGPAQACGATTAGKAHRPCGRIEGDDGAVAAAEVQDGAEREHLVGSACSSSASNGAGPAVEQRASVASPPIPRRGSSIGAHSCLERPSAVVTESARPHEASAQGRVSLPGPFDSLFAACLPLVHLSVQPCCPPHFTTASSHSSSTLICISVSSPAPRALAVQHAGQRTAFRS